ncbi:MAG: DUF2851 family protein [Hydrotalea sp.]|nr:DUF2851 family protein [Hydrotalea sp.]
MIDEKLFQFIWKHRYFQQSGLVSTDGEPIQVKSIGQLNNDQGPDFLMASIQVGSISLVGHVELHIRSSDWLKHGHQNDPRFAHIILHVVWENDVSLKLSAPTLVLQPYVAAGLFTYYKQLMQMTREIPCASFLPQLNALQWLVWQERLMVEKLATKVELFIEQKQKRKVSWEEVLWWKVARYFGGKVNADLFEQAAMTVSTGLISKLRSNRIQIEAILLGQANMLEQNFDESYPKMLQKEFRFLQIKYSFQRIAIQPSFLRMRPVAFPGVRLSQLSVFMQQQTSIFSSCLSVKNVQDLLVLFDVVANDYWHYHYVFDHETPYQPKVLGKETAWRIIVNAVVPVLFAYAHEQQNEQLKEKLLSWLHQIPAEDNVRVKQWKKHTVPVRTALEAQSLQWLTENYCQVQKCLQCAVGADILKKGATTS